MSDLTALDPDERDRLGFAEGDKVTVGKGKKEWIIHSFFSGYDPGVPLARLESTGVDPHRDRIVSAAVIKIDPDANPAELSEADAHGAEADAMAAGRLAWAICQRHGYRADATSLHEELTRAKRAQADSFGKYLVKQGKVDDVSRSWPVQEFPAGWAPDQMPAERAVA